MRMCWKMIVRSPAAISVSLFLMTMGCLASSSTGGEDIGASLPRFPEIVPNITVTVGRDALLPCTVEHLKGYKVAWVQVDTQTILTIHKQVITRNPRIALLHNDHRSWHLQIKNVREGDRGWYMCQVNTDPMRSRQGYVDVVVPPDIIDRESSGDLTVREGQDVTLTCKAKGHPPPKIVWRREDNSDIILDTSQSGRGSRLPTNQYHHHHPGSGTQGSSSDSGSGEVDGYGDGRGAMLGSGGGDSAVGTAPVVEGETLVLRRVSRLQMGSYLCIASNGIPPSISKRVHLSVQFPPMTWVPQQLEGAYVGREVTLECHTEAHPISINYWVDPRGDMVVSGGRYETVVAESSYKVYMKLRIRNVQKRDFGTFHCVAKNSLGETDGTIRIYEIDPPKSHLDGHAGEDDGEEEGREGEEGEGGERGSSEGGGEADLHERGGGKYSEPRHPKGINDLPHGSKGGGGGDKEKSGQLGSTVHLQGSGAGYSYPSYDHGGSGTTSSVLNTSSLVLLVSLLSLSTPDFVVWLLEVLVEVAA